MPPLHRVEIAINCLEKRLQSSDQNTVYLTEVLCDACIKNCAKFPYAMRKSFMDEFVQIAKGTKGTKAQDEALRLIKLWDSLFSKNRDKMPYYSEAYKYLKDRGVVFPDIGSQPPLETNERFYTH
jgi:hypothetical protein